ncbi:hypothetical protein M514_04043 [Trichuris suis]|uniref:Sigma non-opioid intracellular receptor 1 n=1 Tax=Trichuris suis TaxID=68888 RepID=A0A085MD29_9BILA|nr:hypothetical protein M513_04043 [Trichuris suis]KFD72523.1 hypothetical protein M514_04043 [Trichuris suis]KHJ48768.1 ERG2 and Sigma1 receptor like protein [Trichuris suis]
MLSSLRQFVVALRLIFLVGLCASIVHYTLMQSWFVFSPRRIRSLGEKYAGQPLADSVIGIHRDLSLVYGRHVIDPWSKGVFDYFEKPKYPRSRGSEAGFWLPFYSGGLVGRIHFIHVSFSEYVAIVGSPVRTVGMSGWLWMNHTCTVLSGSLERLDGLQRENFQPGKHVRFGQFESSIVELNEETWLFCYGRGYTPLAVPYLTFGMASHAHFVPIIQLMSIGANSYASECFNWAKESTAKLMDMFRKK